ncbi:VapE domain-containing protein [Arcicella sp. DC2W]|uniref:VapE domain-containing protein n=1 Tax=Arcicella gelida TaxID=2984195 RepID=A0ABU5S7M3_9BACT|nr:VapE domain-containing protein [Arcicella sp. DC2W]MEA5404472.1 VapE domain-containing protein [Arcicella sp. DC2W]
MAYLLDRLEQLKISEEQNSIEVIRVEGEEHRTTTNYFSSDEHDNIRILYPRLDGHVYTFDSGSKNNPDKWFYRTRLKNPKSPSEKYTQPAKSGTRPFFPKNIISKYLNKTEIHTLTITEGEFKAFKADIHGFDIVGVPSIHAFYGENKELHADIVDLIEVCNVKNLIFLTDADTLSVNWEPKKDLAKRATSFYSAVRNFAEASQKIEILKQITFAHIHAKYEDNAKGLDDLLVSLEGKEEEILKDLTFKIKRHFNFIDLTTFKKTQLLNYFGIGKNVEDFYKLYSKYIAEEKFIFRDVEYQYNGKKVVVIEQEDSFNDDMQNRALFTEKLLFQIRETTIANIKKGQHQNKTISDCQYIVENFHEKTISDIKLKSMIEKLYIENKSIFNINNLHYILKLKQIFERNYNNFRRNELSGACEINGKALSDSDINTIMLDIEVSELLGYSRTGVPIGLSQDKFYQFINSNYTMSYHPIKEFFENSPEPTETGLISKLAKTIITNQGLEDDSFAPNFVEHFLTKWLVSCIASVYGTPNPLLLILSGTKQRTGKTEFFRRLLPPELKTFMSENKITEEKDQVLAMIMSEKFMILDDEMSGLTKADAKRVKYLCSVLSFTYKRPYAKGTTTVARLANLCATTNDPNILTDPTGNRRLIPIDVQAIDHTNYNAIDKTQLWLEIYQLYKSGYKYALDSDDVKLLNDNTKSFEAIDKDSEWLNIYFDNPNNIKNIEEAGIVGIQEMTASEISHYVKEKTGHIINVFTLKIKLEKELGLIQQRTNKKRYFNIAVLK